MNIHHYWSDIVSLWSIFYFTFSHSHIIPFALIALSYAVNCGAKVGWFDSFGGRRDEYALLCPKIVFENWLERIMLVIILEEYLLWEETEAEEEGHHLPLLTVRVERSVYSPWLHQN